MKSRQPLLVVLALCYGWQVFAQDTVTTADISRYAYSFDQTTNGWNGKGADVLDQALEDAQIVMLGNHHRSLQEEILATMITKRLDQFGCRNMILEIGPASCEVLNQYLASNPNGIAALKEINAEFGLIRNEKLLAPIPDLKSHEAASRVDWATKNGWSIHALGPESWTSFAMIVNHLYNTSSLVNDSTISTTFLEIQTRLGQLYQAVSSQNNEDILALTTTLDTSQQFNDFMETLANHGADPKLLAALKFSIHHWNLYGQRNYYLENKLSAKRNKALLSDILNENQFDLKNDRLFVQMWRRLMTKGLTANGFYGVGNTLNEIAEMNGNTALNIAIVQRYYLVDGVLHDRLESTDHYSSLFKDFLKFGNEDEYVLIDLRDFNEAFFWKGYHINDNIEKVYKSYDLLIISKTDMGVTELK